MLPPWRRQRGQSPVNLSLRFAMAKAANERGQHDEVKDLAEAIIDTQEREIGIVEMHAAGEHHG